MEGAGVSELVRKLAAATIALLLAAGVAGCTTSSDTEETARELEGQVWRMVSYTNADGLVRDAIPDVEVTAEFVDGTLSGSGGCNSYNASYETDGSSIEIGPAAATLMACEEPVMDQEQVFFAGLGNAAEYSITGNELGLADAEGNGILRFVAED
jgi:putative lipoprotein